MASNKLEVVEVDHGVANRFQNTIEINKNLRKYPKMLKHILEHELAHSNDWISWHDLRLDFMSDTKVSNLNMLKFMVKHPKSFTQLLPFYWGKQRGFVYDVNLIILYSIMFGVFATTIFLGMRYL